jgi:hypothetical protein
MEPAAAFELYRRKVFAQPELTAADGGLFAAMRAEDKKANLRLVMGVSRWLIDRIEAIPQAEQIAAGLDPLALLTQCNGVVGEKLRAYKGENIEEFRGILMPAIEARLHALFGRKL